MPDDLGVFRDGFSKWRKALAKADEGETPIVFAEAMSHAAGWVAEKGLDYTTAVAELTDMAGSIGLGAADEERVAEILDNAIAIRMAERESDLAKIARWEREYPPQPVPDHGLPENWVSVEALWEALNDPRRHTAKSTLDAAAWLWFQVGDDPKRFRAFLDKHSDAERADIMRHIKKIAEQHNAADER